MALYMEFYVSEDLREITKSEFSVYFDDDDICEKIELGCYSYAENFCSDSHNKKLMSNGIYKEIMGNLLYNFRHPNDSVKNLTKMIKGGKLDPEELAYLRPHELNSSLWKRIIERKKATHDKLNNFPTITRERPCGCGANQFLFYQLQTRSVDEPITTFYICKECDRTYKVNR